MIRGGYRGKILRVDLTSGDISDEALPDEEVLRKYIGNFGLGLWYLLKELPLGVAATEPENPLIFMNAPLVGTRAPASNNCTITTLNADTGFTAGRSHSHGWFGVFLGRAGYDGIVITGKSDKWVYLSISDENIELRDASRYLGKDTHETEDQIKEDLGVSKELGAEGGCSVAAIGPAGENLVAGSAIANDKHHLFAHSGVGSVMGSKHLKAIVVQGSGAETPVADSVRFQTATRDWARATTKLGLSPIVGRAGVPRDQYEGVRGLVGLSSKNWLVNDIPGFGNGMGDHDIKTVPCYRCPVACCYEVTVKSGPFEGYVATLSGGGENMEGSASIVGVGADDPGEVFYLTDLNDRLAVDSSTVGCAMAVAFEAYERGLLTKEDTDGLELVWGDGKVVEKLLNKVARREGFGALLADGPQIAGERVGLPDAAVHIKGAGMSLHDWRRAWGVLLGQIVGGGAGWPAPGADCWTAEADAGYPEKQDPLSAFGKGKEVAKTGIVKMFQDCVGICWFATWGVPGVLSWESEAIGAAVGFEDFTSEEAWNIGWRALTLERVFNIQHGLTAADDLNVSPRITDPAPPDAGPAAGKSIAPYLAGWVREYYETLGWDRRTGKPLRSTLVKLGLEEYIDTVWPKS